MGDRRRELVALRFAAQLVSDRPVPEPLRPLADALAAAVSPLDVDHSLSDDITAVLALLRGAGA